MIQLSINNYQFKTEVKLRRKKVFVLLLLVLTFFDLKYLNGDSIFAINRVGIPVLATDVRSRAMGGVSLALGGENFSALNPALGLNFERSAALLAVVPEYRWTKDQVQSSSNRATMFPLFRFVFPITGGFAFSAGYRLFTDVNYSINIPFLFAGETLTQDIVSEGSIFIAQLAVGKLLFKKIKLGIGVDFYRGTSTETTRVDFSSILPFVDTNDEFSFQYSGTGVTVGVIFPVYDKLDVGLVYRKGPEADVNEEIDLSSGVDTTFTFSASLPSNYGVGVSYSPWEKLTLAAEFQHTTWGDLEFDGERLDNYRDQKEFGFGVEWTRSRDPLDSVFKRIPLRFGYRRTELPVEFNGNSVMEQVGTLGFGFAFGRGRGKLNVSFEFGRRGSLEKNNLQEKFFNLGFSVSIGEKWIKPEGRRRR